MYLFPPCFCFCLLSLAVLTLNDSSMTPQHVTLPRPSPHRPARGRPASVVVRGLREGGAGTAWCGGLDAQSRP